MNRQKQPKLSGSQDPRYNLHRTLSSYQPAPVTDTGTRRQPVITPAPFPIEEVKERKRFTWKKGILLAVLVLLIPVLIIGTWDYRNASGPSKKMFGSGNLFGALAMKNLSNTNGRTNIMLMGYSADDPGHAGANLTDSIMVVSLDKKRKSGYMLSVPRDLYVSIPNYGSAKINEAYQAGERQGFSEAGYPSGGVGLLEKVVSESFDIPIHYYIIINYGAVRELTDSLNGITVNIESPDPRGLYDPNFKPEEGGPLKLENGPQELDGQTALRLTRARGATFGSYGFPQSDFNRTQNQQKVFASIKSEISLPLLLDPRKNKPFFEAVANNVQTDLGLNEVIPMYRLFQSVPDSSLRQVNLRDVDGVNLLASFRTPSGQSALIPAAGISNFSQIQTALQKLSQ